ncbi:MAG: hypothetical protein ACFBWO_13345 [Paracoccaceae bacterium]
MSVLLALLLAVLGPALAVLLGFALLLGRANRVLAGIERAAPPAGRAAGRPSRRPLPPAAPVLGEAARADLAA